jgi:hypothetical protein
VRHVGGRKKIDLVALATHGRSGSSRWLYGSVADAVLHTVTVPLLLLRPGDEAARTFDLRLQSQPPWKPARRSPATT